MKVIHVIKRIEEIDNDIRELKKLEKSVKKNKSFTTPIFMSIEKQINIMLGDRIKMLDLKIENPPESLMKKDIEEDEKLLPPPAHDKQTAEPEKKRKEPKAKRTEPDESLDDEIPMMTQDIIDARISKMEAEKDKNKSQAAKAGTAQKITNDNSVKILDIALEKGTFNDDEKKDKDKKVKFFRDNFPVE